MNEKKFLYSSGQFAKLTGVNKRTLHYYHDIGLFEPEYINENGYHYYSCFQFPQLEFILTLRKIGLSIEEIRTYLSKTTSPSFSEMMETKKKLIDDSINQLLFTKAFLEQKAERLEMSIHAKHNQIELCTLPERKVVLSSPITGAYDENDFSYDENDFSVAAEFSQRLKSLFHLYDNFGSRISIDSIRQKQFQCYDSFFAYCPEATKEADIILEEGTYLRAFCIGPWKKLPEVYESILNYASEQGLHLCGYAYEEGLNELSITSQDDYITMITIMCK